jgi:hypothetical protein
MIRISATATLFIIAAFAISGSGDSRAVTPIADFRFRPASVTPGQAVRVMVKIDPPDDQGIRITHPYPIAPSDVLPGFVYDAAKKNSFFATKSLFTDNSQFDRNPATNHIDISLPTDRWPSGVHHFKCELVDASGKVIDFRSFAVKVPDPDNHLSVDVEESYYFAPGTHIDRFIRLRDGTLLYSTTTLHSDTDYSRRSVDGGRTWQNTKGGFGVGGAQLADGSIIGLEYRCGPELATPGWYPIERSISTDNGQSFNTDEVSVFVPEAKPAQGHGSYDGPIFMRSIVERKDGSLVALMAGWFKSDTVICPYGKKRPYSRSYVCESDDGGRTWRYIDTIGYARLGSEGYNEGAMHRLPNGELLVVLRTGNESDFNCQDNPIMWSVSTDEGRTWSPPARTGVEGAFPCLEVLSDGLVVLSYGRPGAMLAFSADNGRTWTDHTLVDATPYSGYTGVVEIAPGELLVGFGTRNYLDPKTRNRGNSLRLARVYYKEK